MLVLKFSAVVFRVSQALLQLLARYSRCLVAVLGDIVLIRPLGAGNSPGHLIGVLRLSGFYLMVFQRPCDAWNGTKTTSYKVCASISISLALWMNTNSGIYQLSQQHCSRENKIASFTFCASCLLSLGFVHER